MKLWDKDCTQGLMIFCLSVFFVYFTSPLIARIAFLISLFLVYNSKKDFIWIAFLFIIYDPPNFFFHGGQADAPLRIPVYILVPGLSLAFSDLMIFVLLLKAYVKGERYPVIFSKQLLLFFTLFLILLFLGILIGMSFDNFVLSIRYVIPLLLFLIIPRLLNTKEQWFGLIKVLLPVVIFTLIGQVYYIVTDHNLASLLTPGNFINSDSASNKEMESLSRYQTGAFISLFCFMCSLYLLGQKIIKINRIYILLIIVAIFLQPLLSATRGYILTYSLILLVWGVLQNSIKNIRVVLISAVVIFIFIISMSQSNLLNKQLGLSLKRLATIETLVKGDLTAGGTYGRITERAPRVMEKFRESPLIGFGFSDQYYLYDDDHIGNHNILLSSGVFGYIIFNSLLIIMVLRLCKFNKIRNEFIDKNFDSVFLIGFIGLFLLHSFGRQFFGYAIPPYVQMLIVLFFSFWNFLIFDKLLQCCPR